MADRSHRPTKVGIFMEFFLPYLGGIERYQDRLSEQLRLLGYDVFIVTSLHDESLPRFEDKDGLRIYRLPTKNLFKQRYPFFKRDERAQVIAAVNRRDKRLRQHMQILGGIPVIQVSVPGLKRLNCVKYMI